MAKPKDKVLVTAWVSPSLRKKANIAAQISDTTVNETIIEALEALIVRAKLEGVA